MVNEFVYCPRLAFLEWVHGEWDDNLDTIHGRWVHRRVDDEPATPVADPDAPPADDRQSISARSVMLSSERLGAIARMDLLEAEGRVATPVDYKRGAVPDTPHRAWDPERVQLCLQGLILRDNGYDCAGGVLYYAESRARVPVAFDDALVAQTLAALEGLRTLATSGRLPPPLVDSPKCPRCSLVGICLPDETNALRRTSVTDGEADEVRRLVPARPDALPLHVQAQGATVGKHGDRLRISVPGSDDRTEVRLLDVSSVSLFGNIQVTTQALRACCDEGIPVTFHAQSGWIVGALGAGVGHKNVAVRIRQHAAAVEAGTPLALAARMVEGKIANQRTFLRRNLVTRDPRALGLLALYARQARHAKALDALMGNEGMAARVYFGAFPGLFREQGTWAAERFAESGRNRRPPRDEVNAVLSFLYTLLARDCTLAVAVVGFDPYLGFLHQPHYGRPSLGLDLAEEFRPLVADSVAITVINQGEVTPRSFVRRARGVMLTPPARRAVTLAYERRLTQTVRHPLFGYTVSYRRVLELQARLLRAVVLGEIATYRAFTTR
jgi:CRISPR-associated endonuclease Cas1/CRISPR-associated protein Cas4